MEIAVFMLGLLLAASLAFAIPLFISNRGLEAEHKRVSEELTAIKGEAPALIAKAKESAEKIRKDSEQKAQLALKQTESRVQELSRREKAITDAEVATEVLLKQKAAELEKLKKLAIAERNRIEGWQDQYTLPIHQLLDSLGDHVGWDKAGQRLKQARENSRRLIKERKAVTCNWGDLDYQKDAIRLMLEAFDSQADLALDKVKGKENVGKVIQEITDVAESLNDYAQRCMRAEITEEYIESRLEEARWGAVAFELRRREREEQQEKMAQLREQEKVEREIEKARRDAEKEEEITRRALLKAQEEELNKEKARQAEYERKLKEMEKEMRAAATQDEDERKQKEALIRGQMQELLDSRDRASAEERAKFEEAKRDLEAKLREAEDKNRRALSMAQQTKRGYVYVISNHGSFGEGMLKIGMTRRLDPMDRIWELGDASVPFEFDVHAMISSDDAPGLENKLHKAMAIARVNKVNLRKEFFRLTVKEVREAIESIGVNAEWTMAAKAQEYRETVALDESFKVDKEAARRWLEGSAEESEV
jgi:hypothetical protein